MDLATKIAVGEVAEDDPDLSYYEHDLRKQNWQITPLFIFTDRLFTYRYCMQIPTGLIRKRENMY